jgi:hypothetical protein
MLTTRKPLRKHIWVKAPIVATLALGLRPRQGLAKVRAKSEA